MSKDGYLGTGIKQLDLNTLGYVKNLLKPYPEAQKLVEKEYEAMKKDIEKYLRYSR